MNTKNYFELQLNVSFTMNELMTIATALFTDMENNKEHGWLASANLDRKIRKKLQKQIDMYNEILK